MGIESFGDEPVEDVEKAEAEAYAGDNSREEAIRLRKIASGELPVPETWHTKGNLTKENSRDYAAKQAENMDFHARVKEDVAGHQFDEAKKQEGQE